MNLRLEYRNANELKNNPKNWRKHPDEQKKPLKEIMDKVGWAGAMLYCCELDENYCDTIIKRWD